MVKVFPGYGFKHGDCVVLTRRNRSLLDEVDELPAGSRGTVVKLDGESLTWHGDPLWGVRFYKRIAALDEWGNVAHFGVEDDYIIHPADLMLAWEHDTRFFPPSVLNVSGHSKVLRVMMERQLVGYEQVMVEILVPADFDHERRSLHDYSAQIETAIRMASNDEVHYCTWSTSDWEPRDVDYVDDHFA